MNCSIIDCPRTATFVIDVEKDWGYCGEHWHVLKGHYKHFNIKKEKRDNERTKFS